MHYPRKIPTFKWPFLAASWRGVSRSSPSPPKVFTLAPYSMSSLTTWTWPLLHASWSGVYPVISRRVWEVIRWWFIVTKIRQLSTLTGEISNVWVGLEFQQFENKLSTSSNGCLMKVWFSFVIFVEDSFHNSVLSRSSRTLNIRRSDAFWLSWNSKCLGTIDNLKRRTLGWCCVWIGAAWKFKGQCNGKTNNLWFNCFVFVKNE